jgi:hypothetical protein
MAIIKILSDLDIALENSKKKSDEIVDGKRSEHRIEGRGKSQDEEDSENSPTEDDSSSQGEEASQGEERETYIQYSSTINNFML